VGGHLTTDPATAAPPAAGGSNRGLIRLVLGLCGLAGLLVAAMFVILLVSVVDLRDEVSHARRESDLLNASASVERSVVDLETGLRGYLLSHQRSFLAPYEQARLRLPGELGSLRALSESQAERYQVASISAAIGNYINGYAQPLVATGGRLSDRQEARVTVIGRRLIDRLRLELTALSNDESMLRNRGRSRVNAQSAAAIVIAAVGLGLSIALLLGLGAYLLLGILRPMRRVADAAGRLASGQLATRVPEAGLGEVSMLAHSFNAMASALEERERELSEAHAQLSLAVKEAREASELKSSFLANMSHEIRTPLGGVIGMMDLLCETDLSAEQREYVSVATASGQALMMVVNDVLDVAKIEAGRLELEHRHFDLPDLVESACDMVAATSASKGLELQSYVHDDVPATVRGDRARVGQILANLLSNAVKFTARGEVILEVSLAPGTGDHRERAAIRFEVRDTGIGIAPEKIGQLFEPFRQAEAGTTRAYGGTGLGLTIVRELTRMMQGSVEVDSEPGRGSTFAVTLPLEVSREGRRLPPATGGLRGLRVLIVDDNATNRRIFEAYTRSWEMRPALADSVGAAVRELELAARRDDPFEVLLVDLNMPGESGLDLIGRVARDPALAGTRVILLTSSGEATHEHGPDVHCVLTKPVRQSRLFDAIGSVISNRPHGRGADAPAGPEVRTPSKRGRILVAEDQPVNWMLVERLLVNRGHRAENALDGEQALKMLESKPFDLVLMDCHMPVLDGFAATRELRLREATKHRPRTPVVAMTANAMEGDRERCLAAGMDDYLAKPITSRAIDEILARWLRDDAWAQTSVLDAERMKELRSLFPGQETVEMFVQLQQEGELQLERIASALQERNPEEAAEGAHRILSSARMVGASALVEAATELQSSVGAGRRRAEDIARAERVYIRVRQQWDAVSRALEAELRSGLR